MEISHGWYVTNVFPKEWSGIKPPTTLLLCTRNLAEWMFFIVRFDVAFRWSDLFDLYPDYIVHYLPFFVLQ